MTAAEIGERVSLKEFFEWASFDAWRAEMRAAQREE